MKRFFILLSLIAAGLSGVPATASTWTGGSNANWSNGGNWSGGVPGASGLALFSSGPLNGTTTPLVIDTTGLKVLTVNFDSSAFNAGATSNTGYTIGTTGGNALTLSTSGTISLLNTFNGLGVTEAINAPLVLSGNTAFTNATALGSNDVL